MRKILEVHNSAGDLLGFVPAPHPWPHIEVYHFVSTREDKPWTETQLNGYEGPAMFRYAYLCMQRDGESLRTDLTIDELRTIDGWRDIGGGARR